MVDKPELPTDIIDIEEVTKWMEYQVLMALDRYSKDPENKGLRRAASHGVIAINALKNHASMLGRLSG